MTDETRARANALQQSRPSIPDLLDGYCVHGRTIAHDNGGEDKIAASDCQECIALFVAELARLEAERDEARGALARAEEARRLEEAAALEAEGRREEAEQVLDEEPALIEAPIAPPPTPKVAGVYVREKWTAEVTDKAAFVRAVAANPGALNQMASALKSDLKIPGVNVRREQVVSARGRATGRRGVAVTPASVAKRVKSLLELEAAEGPLVSGETEGA